MKCRFNKTFAIKPLTKMVSVAIISMASSQALSANFQLGDVDISFDSTFSLGTSWRVEDRDWSNRVGKANNPQNGFDFSGFDAAFPSPSNTDVWDGAGSYSTNGDNGNLNYNAGEAFSTIFKGSHDLDIRYDNIGLFVRGMYYYDFEMSDSDRAWTNPVSGLNNDPCRDNEASQQVCRDIRLLDAYVYGDFYLDDMPLTIKVGQQVISWGESSLISHGISELNPVDIARLRAPGSELKEAFIPYGAIWGSLGVTDTFSIEAFYQYSWEKTILPAPGSYFSNNDFAGDGGQYANVQLGFAGGPDMDLDYLLTELNSLGDGIRAGLDPAIAGQLYLAYPTQLTLRAPGKLAENEPDDGGQYGLRLSWYLPELNDTEISAYYMNYHSRRPVFSGKTANFTPSVVAADVAMIAAGKITEQNYYQLGSFSQVELDYVEDIKLYALSFNTVVGETSVAGELTYRQDEPLQIDDVELLFAAMPQQLANTGHPDYAAFDGISQMDVFEPGSNAEGFVLSDTVQAQFTLTHLFGPSLGASQLTGLIEVGGINIQDMPDPDVLRLNGPGTDRNGGIAGKAGLELAIQDGVETNPFPDEFAWGYRAVAKLDYNNVFAGINVTPRVVFSHDVSGTTPDPLFLFIEKRKSVSMGVTFDYQSRWSADVSYNGFWDGVGTTNQMEDRDYVSLSIKYSI
ncbi:DUF1302 domain-containing protein [Thalassotalea agariperforans]